MRRFASLITTFVLTAILVVSFQNCGRGFQASLPAQSSLVAAVSSPSNSAPVEELSIVTPSYLPTNKQILGANVVETFPNQAVLPDEEPFVLGLYPTSLRIPSGTHADYYDWSLGQFIGIGNNPLKSLEQLFARSVTNNIPISYIVNVAKDTPEKTKALAELMKARGYNVEFWELGNEMAAERWHAKFPTYVDYLNEARKHAQVIREVFPEARFGLTTQNAPVEKSPWNQGLAAQTEFTNIIIHKYIGLDKTMRQNLNHEINLEKAYQVTLNSSSGKDVQKLVTSYPHKHLYLTEFGMMYMHSDYQNSLGHGIWMARIMMDFLREPKIAMASYWNLNTSPFETFANIDGNIIRRIPYFVLDYYAQAIQNHELTSEAQLKIGSSEVENLKAQNFKNFQGENVLLLVNGSGAGLTFRLPPGLKLIQASGIGADSFMATNGTSLGLEGGFASTVKQELVAPQNWAQGEIISVPPYAIGMIKYQQNDF